MSSDRLGQEGKIRHLVESKRFVFNATSVNPQRANILNTIPNGNRLRDLTPGYFLSVMNDSISAYLPYFGRAYSAPYSTTDNGINVNTKKFSYTSKPGKKGVYIIKIIVDNDKNTQSFLLNIGTSGYATLQVQSVYRDAISFYGNIEPVKGDIE
ncbi:MAG TPA: DUF4251 domain-containing protein [Arachidicoccus sp.]